MRSRKAPLMNGILCNLRTSFKCRSEDNGARRSMKIWQAKFMDCLVTNLARASRPSRLAMVLREYLHSTGSLRAWMSK